MPRQPSNPSATRRARLQAWSLFAVAAVLVALITYLGYVAVEGSRILTATLGPTLDCRSPASLGWEYEAVNYDAHRNGRLTGHQDVVACGSRGEAGGEVVTSDGIRIAAWYVPADASIGPGGPTVVLAHGWGGNKGSMLPYAAMLRDRYNVVAFDFRRHGQSSGNVTTQGVLEQRDVRAVLDWLEREKRPEAIALFGVSMGGATVINVADDDRRVDAVILDSTHATLANAVQARLDAAGYPFSLPASWAVLMGGLVRTGLDMSSADPIQAVERLGDTPLLILQGGADVVEPGVNARSLLAAAEQAGVDAELRICEEAAHSGLLDACSDDYEAWVLGFLERSLGR